MLAADPAARARHSPGRAAMLAHLAAVRDAMQHALHAQLVDGQSISTTSELAAYLRLEMGFEPAEQVRVLFLDVGNRLISNEVLFRGTVDAAPLYARPIVHRALDLGAAALILVHNHPSGEPEPSRGDVDATLELGRALAPLDILIHDHVIVARRGWTSQRQRGRL